MWSWIFQNGSFHSQSYKNCFNHDTDMRRLATVVLVLFLMPFSAAEIDIALEIESGETVDKEEVEDRMVPVYFDAERDISDVEYWVSMSDQYGESVMLEKGESDIYSEERFYVNARVDDLDSLDLSSPVYFEAGFRTDSDEGEFGYFIDVDEKKSFFERVAEVLPSFGEQESEKPDVILITLESVRSDSFLLRI